MREDKIAKVLGKRRAPVTLMSMDSLLGNSSLLNSRKRMGVANATQNCNYRCTIKSDLVPNFKVINLSLSGR